jgi:hypothetical protein
MAETGPEANSVPQVTAEKGYRKGPGFVPESGNPFTATEKKSIFKRFKEARLSRKTAVAAAGATAGISSLVGAFLGDARGSADLQRGQDADRGFEPDSSSTVQIIETPAPQGEYTKVPGTNVEIPTITAVPKATETTAPTQKPTEKPAPVTPEPTKVAEKPAAKWVVEVSPEVKAMPVGPEKRTIEQDLAIINSVVEKFPKIGNLKIVLTSQQQSEFDIQTQELKLGRDISAEALKWKIAHELTHYLDVALNETALSKYLTGLQIQELKDLREKALNDPVWGREYPVLDKIFNPLKESVILDSSKKYTEVQLVALANKYADAVWIGGRGNLGEQKVEPFRPFMKSTFDEIAKLAEVNANTAGFMTIDKFINSPEVKAKIDALGAKDPLFATAISLILEKKDLFDVTNAVWPNSYAAGPVLLTNAHLSGWKILPTFVELVLEDGYNAGDNRVLGAIPAGVDRKGAEVSMQAIKVMADREKLAELAGLQESFGVKTSAAGYFAKLGEFSK